MDHAPHKIASASADIRTVPAVEPSTGGIVRDPATTLIRISEVVAIVGLARPTIYKLLRQPESGFPQPVKLSQSEARGAPVGWVLGEVRQWVLARIAARRKAAA